MDDHDDDRCPGWRQDNLCAGYRHDGHACNRFAAPGSRYCYEHPDHHDATPPLPTRPPWIESGMTATEWAHRRMHRE